MVVSFSPSKGENEDPVLVNVKVDYFNNRVFFDDKSMDGVDYEDLEQEILCYLRPSIVEKPELPPEIMQRISDARNGQYRSNVPNYGDKNEHE